MGNFKQTRMPVFAGSFYPADKNELSDTIDEYLGRAEAVKSDGRLKILIVPHAGLEYSGATAAWGFKQIAGKNYTRVVLLGVSHRSWFDYAAVYGKGIWKTPLGKVEVDGDLSSKLLAEKIIADIKPHEQEHSLEIELIFLQKVLKDFKIVPVLLGQVSDKVINRLSEKISQSFDEETLLVISSDLSHYPSWTDANDIDDQTTRAIISGDINKFEETISGLESKGYPNLDTCACGADAIKVALQVANGLGLKDFKKIKYENSGDVSGEKSRVVGYVAIGIYGVRENPANVLLDKKAREEALQIARKTLEDYFDSKGISPISPVNPVLLQPLGAFVTLRNKSQLRGCIGIFEPNQPLFQVIQEMVIAAATEDLRFSPVSADEVKDITIEISVMTPKRKIDDWNKIELGKQGVVIQKGFRSGTFLPQVATETGWSKEEFLSQLCSQKAGLPPECYKDPDVILFVFEAQVFEEEQLQTFDFSLLEKIK